MNIDNAFVSRLIQPYFSESEENLETIGKVELVALSSLLFFAIFAYIVFCSRKFNNRREITQTDRTVQCVSAKLINGPIEITIEQELIEFFPFEERNAVSKKIQDILSLWEENPSKNLLLKKIIREDLGTQVFLSLYDLCEGFIPDSTSIVNNLITAILSIKARFRPQAVTWMKKIFAANKEKNECIISDYLILFIQSMQCDEDVDVFIEYFRLYPKSSSIGSFDEIHSRRNGLGQNNLSCFEKHSPKNRIDVMKIVIHATRSDGKLRNIIFDLIHDCGLLQIDTNRLNQLSEFLITHKENLSLLSKFGELIDLTLGSLLENFIPHPSYDIEKRENAKSNIEARKKVHEETKIKVKEILLNLNLERSVAEAQIISFLSTLRLQVHIKKDNHVHSHKITIKPQENEDSSSVCTIL